MPVNPSRTTARFQAKWSVRKHGKRTKILKTSKPGLFKPPFISVPPPSKDVSRAIGRIIGRLVAFRQGVYNASRQGLIFSQETNTASLLINISEAISWVGLCEYGIAKEHLNRTLVDRDNWLKLWNGRQWVYPSYDQKKFYHSVEKKIKKVFLLCDRCMENDRRSSYHWEQYPIKRAA